MKLLNTIVTFTVIIPSLEVDKELGLQKAKDVALAAAQREVARCRDQGVVTDCPDYPALCN